MQIQEFSFKNICSYGNKLQTIKFTDEPRLVLVQGLNGSGKSSISDALTVSIYGKSATRKIKEIPNRINKNAYTHIKFKTSSGRDVEIERGIEPNFSNVSIDGEGHKLPDKRRVDEFIEDELVKIPFNVFSNTISLSINDFKSFVKLSPNDKRQIIDKILGLDIINDMSKLAKEDTKKIKAEISPIESSILNNQRILESSLSQLEKLKSDISINTESKILEIKQKLSQLREQKTQFLDKQKEFLPTVKEVRDSIQTLRDKQSTVRANLAEIQKKLELYSQNKCPHCLSDLTDAIHTQMKVELQEKKEKYEAAIPKINELVSTKNSELVTLEESVRNSTSKVYSIDAEISPLIRELDTLQKTTSDDSTKYITEIIDKVKAEIEESTSTLSVKKEELGVSQELESILGDSGMKQMLMSQIIPLLNKRILKTSKVLEFKFAFEFDLEFNPIITHLGMQVSPDSLSTGEQKKMNLIVLLSMIELIKMKHNNVNLLFLDEIFSSLDVGVVYKVVDLLRAFSKKYGMTVFVISHEPLPSEFFDTKLQIANVDHFSDIVQLA